MKTCMRKFIVLSLSAILSVPFAVGAQAAFTPPPAPEAEAFAGQDDGGISLFFTHINVVKYNFVINSGGLAYIDSSMYLESNGTSCKIEAVLQRRKLHEGWATVKTFTATGQARALMSYDWYLYSGYEHRVIFNFYAYENGRLAEQITKTSPIRSY